MSPSVRTSGTSTNVLAACTVGEYAWLEIGRPARPQGSEVTSAGPKRRCLAVGESDLLPELDLRTVLPT